MKHIWGREIGKWLVAGVGELLLLFGRIFDLDRNGIISYTLYCRMEKVILIIILGLLLFFLLVCLCVCLLFVGTGCVGLFYNFCPCVSKWSAGQQRRVCLADCSDGNTKGNYPRIRWYYPGESPGTTETRNTEMTTIFTAGPSIERSTRLLREVEASPSVQKPSAYIRRYPPY